jgi:hypothetical protein
MLNDQGSYFAKKGRENATVVAIGAAALLVALGFGIGVIDTMPDHAVVIYDGIANEYATFRCIRKGKPPEAMRRFTVNGPVVSCQPPAPATKRTMAGRYEPEPTLP